MDKFVKKKATKPGTETPGQKAAVPMEDKKEQATGVPWVEK